MHLRLKLIENRPKIWTFEVNDGIYAMTCYIIQFNQTTITSTPNLAWNHIHTYIHTKAIISQITIQCALSQMKSQATMYDQKI